MKFKELSGPIELTGLKEYSQIVKKMDKLMRKPTMRSGSIVKTLKRESIWSKLNWREIDLT